MSHPHYSTNKMTHDATGGIAPVDLYRLIALNSRGVYLSVESGHVYITLDENHPHPMHIERVSINSKVYGGVRAALDLIDAALIADGQESLLDKYENISCYCFPTRETIHSATVQNPRTGDDWLT